MTSNIEIEAILKGKEAKNHVVFDKLNGVALKIENFFFSISLIALAAILISMLYGIFAREILNVSALWTNDFAGYAVIYVVFMGAPKLLREGGHVSVDLFTNLMSKFVLKLFSYIVCIICIFTCILLFKYSFDVMYSYYVNDITMLANVAWPKFALVLPICIGTLLLTIRFVLEIFNTAFYGKTIYEGTDEIGH